MNQRSISKLFPGPILITAACLLVPARAAADGYQPFEGEKSSWHDGFDRYDYMMDEVTLDIQPFKRADDERFGIKDPPTGKRRCVVIVPRKARRGQPLVVARMLLGPSTANRGGAAQARLSHRLHLGQRDLETGQDVGRLVRLPHGETRAVQQAGVRRDESRRGIRLHMGDCESGQGFVHLCRQSRGQPRRSQEARRPCGGRRARPACLRQHRSASGASFISDREYLSAIRWPDLRDDQGRGRPSSAQPARRRADRRFHFTAGSAGRKQSAPVPERQDHPGRRSTAGRTPTVTFPAKESTSPAAGRGSARASTAIPSR